ncbi:MAG: hypothetical protein WCO56_13915, partial [Verrucomicrobiota bacterium]
LFKNLQKIRIVKSDRLLERIRSNGIPLKEFAQLRPLYGIKTGLNEAFLISKETRNRLVAEDRNCEETLRPYLRGQDIGRWIPDWANLWMIVLPSSNDRAWPWADLGEQAEAKFKAQYPSLHGYLKPLEERLRNRQDQGKYWWELRSCAYWQEFLRPKLCIQRIAFHSRIARDDSGMLVNDAAIILPTTDQWLLACLNSPTMWFFSFRFFPHKKDEALAMDIPYVERLSIPRPTPQQRQAAETNVRRLIEITASQQQTQRMLLDWLRVEYMIEKPGNKLQSVTSLDSDTWVSEVKRIRGKKLPLTAAGVHALREEYIRTIEPARALAVETLKLEGALSDLVNQAYGLTPAEIDLMWQTAPPRMPIPTPTP